MYSLFDTDEMFLLEGECPNCAEAIPLLVRGDGVTTNLEDVVKPKGASLIDDCGDSCLAAGTLIDTARGLVAIETVTTKDYVLTRKGYRRVLWSGQTGIKPVMRLDSLLITPNHPVFSDGQFVMACDTLSPCLFTRSKSYLKALHIGAIPSQSTPIYENTSVDERMAETHSYTSRCIEAHTEKSPKDTRFITKILTGSITNLRTWWHSLTSDISRCTEPQEIAFAAEGLSFQPLIKAILIGNTVLPDVNDSERSANSAEENTHNPMESWRGRNSALTPASPHGEERAGLTMWQGIATDVASLFPSIATKLLGFAPEVAQVRDRHAALLPARPVYNLSVEGEEEYFANGILVHNCRYAIAGALLDPADKPKEELLREKLAGIKDDFTKRVIGYKEFNLEQAKLKKSHGGGKIVPSWQRRIGQ
jgi:hypothetical protein